MKTFIDTIISRGSLILVTTANRYIESISLMSYSNAVTGFEGVFEAMQERNGCSKVSTTGMEIEGSSCMLWKGMVKEGAYNEAVKGVSGIIHTVPIMVPGPNPSYTIPRFWEE
ncbi:hypothetical protein AFLA70_144g002331 [Aspergillus flavus AF70]|nr:hypothetical protein AFLA70_144g002331 [Aspergillus flavus AF70]